MARSILALACLAAAAEAVSMRGNVIRAHTQQMVRAEFKLRSITDCGAGNNAAGTFSSLTLTPDPPSPGMPAKLAGAGTVNEVVSAGTGAVTVSVDGVQLFSGALNTCGQTQISLPLGLGTVDVDAMTCPTTAGGAFTLGAALTIPSIAPAGNYDVKLSANDQNGNLAFCADAQFTL